MHLVAHRANEAVYNASRQLHFLRTREGNPLSSKVRLKQRLSYAAKFTIANTLFVNGDR